MSSAALLAKPHRWTQKRVFPAMSLSRSGISIGFLQFVSPM